MSWMQPLTDVDGNAVSEQILAVGPAASKIAIKQVGTNGGGFCNVNSAHLFENATPFSNFLEMLSINLIGAALVYTIGKLIGDTRQGWALVVGVSTAASYEHESLHTARRYFRFDC
jgi:K+-transporting ATPase ATPase A chain